MTFRKEEFLRSLKHIAGQKFTWFAIFMVSLTATAFSTRTDDHYDTVVAEEAQEMEAPVLERLSNTDTELLTADEHANTPLPATELPRALPAEQPAAEADLTAKLPRISETASAPAKANKLIRYANSLMGTPYIYGGTSLKGFDCSGFIHHVFGTFDVELERSSRMQGTQGTEVALEEVQKGDLLFFTGTNPKLREVGHVGIVISEPGEPVSFIHSSSNGGVKVSELEGYYTTRYMFAKRML
ncbi:C40 family peptidase [Cesiribacter andamanensis]|uniref:Putative endopeptidase Spr n=1 Tax=Cesiribacter andamanensis AMV16 TaxID=1279009 RepID=M7NHV6_9BACT|nr:C40 family peptidase [Cesiribacter andamanensis]EMR01390.1 putative endopeptidase Spr precursor [Cesiribacter andamanensis AMV16]